MQKREENHQRCAIARITTSIVAPTGSGKKDPTVLLSELLFAELSQSANIFNEIRTFDTYDGQNRAEGPDWYALEFTQTETFNCIEMTMGLPYRDGGWWTSLEIEIDVTGEGIWKKIAPYVASPPYSFVDKAKGRLPFTTHALVFDEVTAKAIRLIGKPGGIAEFTSLARITVYRRDLAHWNPTTIPEPPIPQLFQLIPPGVFWDFSCSLNKLTGLTISLPSFVECYLDESRYEQFWQMWSRNYHGEPELWFFLADTMGWDVWYSTYLKQGKHSYQNMDGAIVSTCFYNTMAYAVAPITINEQVIGSIRTQPALLKERFDSDWHQWYAQKQQLDWSLYKEAMQRSPQLTLRQYEGIADLLSMITHKSVELAQKNNLLEQGGARKELVRHAVEYMKENVGNAIEVSDVAREVGLSASHFCAIFTQHIGCHPSEYLISLRIELAKKYLTYTTMSVTHICTLLGYTPSHFSRLFKQHTGMPPKEYAQYVR